MKPYNLLKQILRNSTISTHPGEVVIQTEDRHRLFELLMDVAGETNPCRCIDCGGTEHSHSPDCHYMNDMFYPEGP